MRKPSLKSLTDEELRAEYAVWHYTTVHARVSAWVDYAARQRDRVTAEGWRRDRDFWRETRS